MRSIQINLSTDASRASVHTRVELFYRHFLEEIETEHTSEDTLFEAHLKTIIWGVLYIEGLVNYKLYTFNVTKLSTPDLVDSYWKLTRRTNIQDKLDLVFAADRVERPWLLEVKKKFHENVEERNRLVHFKDVPTAFEFSVLREKLGTNAPSSKWIEHTPHPKVVADLLSEPIEERIKLFLSLGDSLENVQHWG
ncbi:MAG TPA: hypothetical protein VMV70_04140 [Gallionella sp.]|nr:hypothetical protein [Gallionella sp.]